MNVDSRKIISVVILSCFIGTCFLVYQALAFESGVLQVVFLDVGQGDSIFIQTPSGKQILIDAGKYTDIGSLVAPYMSLNDRSLDMIIATHPDVDHIGGFISLVNEYDIDVFVHSGLLAGAREYQELAHTINEHHIPTVVGVSGSRIFLDKNVSLDILSPYPGFYSDEANEYSLVMRLVYGETSLMLTGDATIFNEYDLVSMYGENLESNILKLGHHGSKTSTSELWLDSVHPQSAIISRGCNNRFGHPHNEVVDRITERNIEMFDTCLLGDIVFESDGEIWLKK